MNVTQQTSLCSLPFRLKLATPDGTTRWVIGFDHRLPAQATCIFSAAGGDQTCVEVRLIMSMGRIDYVADIEVGCFVFKGITPTSQGVSQLEVTLEIDQACRVKASATEKPSGRKLSAEASEIQIQLSDDKIGKALRQRAELTLRRYENFLQRYPQWPDKIMLATMEKGLVQLRSALQESNYARIATSSDTLEWFLLDILETCARNDGDPPEFDPPLGQERTQS